MSAFLGILVFAALLLPGIFLAVLGVIGLRRSGDTMKRALSVVALVVGVSVVCVLGVAVVAHWTPWNALIALAAGGLAVSGGIFWVMLLADCLMNETREGNERLVWTLVMIFTLVVGAGLYYFLRRPRRLAESSEA